MLIKFTGLFAIYLCLSYSSFSQGDTLIGAVDGKLIKVSHTDAGIANYQTVASLPPGNVVSKLTWSAINNCFYTLHAPGTVSNQLGKISADGVYSILGTVTISGGTVYHMESIMYDPRTCSIYAAASLDGTVPSDYLSESFIRIDTATLEATLIGTFTHSGTTYGPEADNLTHAEDGFFYYSDSQPGGTNFMRIYRQDISMLTPPVLIYDDPLGGNIGDLTIKGDLYFTVDRVLRKLELPGYTHSVIGTMFGPSDFSGMQISGLDWHHNYFADVKEEVQSDNYIIYPNPSNGLITIQVNDDAIYSIHVLSLNGAVLKSFQSGSKLTTLDLNDLSNGTYLIQIQIEDQIISVSRIDLIR